MKIPIGILTQDRPLYLAATLHSLSGTNLRPEDATVTVFDDGSVSRPAVLQFNYPSSERVEGFLEALPGAGRFGYPLEMASLRPTGIADKVRVCSLGPDRVGVVNASKLAIRHLFETSISPFVVLLQDDIIFKTNWLEVLKQAANEAGPSLGIMAGLNILHQTDLPPGVEWAYTLSAQCLLLTRPFFETCRTWFYEQSAMENCFDSGLCYAATSAGFSVGVVRPYVCQHIGIMSRVHPRLEWGQGRVGRDVAPPYAWSATLRSFQP